MHGLGIQAVRAGIATLPTLRGQNRGLAPALLRTANESEISMTNTLWFLWMAFIFLFLVSPLSYGWGYRGWGPPYPRYIQRRRALRATYSASSVASRHRAWGWGGDFVWVVLLIGGGWAAAGLLLR